MKSLKILFFTDNFPPEGNAPANRTYEHCVEWIQKGAEVTVITCNPNFPKGKLFAGYKNRLYQKEIMNGIKVIRVWTYITPNRGTVKRILDYLSYAFMSFIASLFFKTDMIIATSPQLFTAVGGYLSAKVKRKPWIMEVRDLWPESIKALGAMDNTTFLKVLERLVNFLYRKANKIIVVTDTFKQRIVEEEGIDEGKIEVVKNGVNNERYYVMCPEEGLMHQHKLHDKFVVGYIGTHGMAHNLDFILDCASEIKDPDIHFLLIGEGAMKKRLLKKKNTLGLRNVTMLDPVSREAVPKYISITDIALVPLKKSDTFKTVIPSKIFENAAMGKPVLLGVEGESKEIITRYGAGVCFEPENQKEFIEKLLLLKSDPQVYDDCRLGGLNLVTDFNREILAYNMLQHIYKTVFQEDLVEEKVIKKTPGQKRYKPV